jgi:biotin carboxylase
MKRNVIVYIDTTGAGLALGLAEAMRKSGIRVGVICPPHAMEAPKRTFAFVIETKDFSLPNLRRLLERIDRRFAIKGVNSCFGPFREDGFLHEAVSQLAAERGLAHSSPYALACATNKFMARYRYAQAGVPDIAFGLAHDADSLAEVAAGIGYPVLLKPLTGVGSSLIFRCNDEAEARRTWPKVRRALGKAFFDPLRMAAHAVATPEGPVFHFDPARQMLVERYIPGRECSVECLVAGDTVYPLLVHDKLDVEERPGVVLEHLLVTPPSRFDAGEARALKAHAASAVRALGLRDMFCHVEMRWLDGHGPRILEVNPRIGAACVMDSIETFTTLDVDRTRAALILGRTVKAPRKRRAPRHAIAFLFAPKTGRIRKLRGLDKVLRLPEVHIVREMASEGARTGGDNEEGFLAGVFFEARNEKEARKTYDKIRELVEIEIV